MADNLYIFDKCKNGDRHLLGEIQSNFNMSFVIDGTKDSAQVVVLGFQESEIEPYTICWHEKTDSWWIVSADKVERFPNDDGNLVYLHTLKLLGAIDLLNARDLTDCGFNDNTYTIRQFITRLFSLSTFEHTLDIYSPILDTYNVKVDFIKTFENYTLLSAIRELLDGYNMCPKLTFSNASRYNSITHQVEYYLGSALLRIISKTGNNLTTPHNITEFDLVKETKTMNKESFGACVVSNAENVSSSQAKTFPSTGSAKLSGTEYRIVGNNAVLRLPSNVYKVNWLKCILTYKVMLWYKGQEDNEPQITVITISALNEASLSSAKDKVHYAINHLSYAPTSTKQQMISDFDSHWEEIKQKMVKAGTISLYNGNSINPVNGKIVKGSNVPYIPSVKFSIGSNVLSSFHQIILADKETRDCLPSKEQGIYWERGSNLIKGFDFINSKETVFTDAEPLFRVDFSTSTDLNGESARFWKYPDNYYDCYLECSNSYNDIKIGNTSWVVNYVPMADLKIKVDNVRNRLDIQLYNQTGKLTDSVALSKLLNSYSKEISSDTITRYMSYYKYTDIPKVGDVVFKGTSEYVINNVSLDFVQNEKDGYFISCEFTMSKRVSTKSLMVNPNTNIRDYGIPQKYNVRRKQIYRDYYEFSYGSAYEDANQESPYLAPNKIIKLGNRASDFDSYTAVIRLTYNNVVENSHVWYYQLETTNYHFNKMFYVMLDFTDNNIIGYGSQNVHSGFDISRIFYGQVDNLNTPISYVDDNGIVNGIELYLLNNQELTTIYQNLQDNYGGSSYTGSLYNYSVFIAPELYEGGVDRSSYNDYNSPSYTGYGSYPSKLDITYFISNTCGYSGSAYGLEITYIYMDCTGGVADIDSAWITKEGNKYYLNISTQSQGYDLWGVNFTVRVYASSWQGAKDISTFKIEEPTYNKDAIEVPVFEYGCQVDDSEDVIVGDKILQQYEGNVIYIYTFIVGDNITQESAKDSQNPTVGTNYAKLTNTVAFDNYLPNYFQFEFYEETVYQSGFHFNNYISSLENGKDVAIFRHAIDISSGHEVGRDLMLILKKLPSGTSRIYLNHYKLK